MTIQISSIGCRAGTSFPVIIVTVNPSTPTGTAELLQDGPKKAGVYPRAFRSSLSGSTRTLFR